MDQSPLARLPPELRNEIYRIVFEQPQTITPHPDYCMTKQWTIRDPLPKRQRRLIRFLTHQAGGLWNFSIVSNPLAVTETYKAIRNEADGLVFNSRTFKIHPDGHQDMLSSLKVFTSMIGAANVSALHGNVLERHTSCSDFLFMDTLDEDFAKGFSQLRSVRLWLLDHPRVSLKVHSRCFDQVGSDHSVSIDMQKLRELQTRAGGFGFGYCDECEQKLGKLQQELQRIKRPESDQAVDQAEYAAKEQVGEVRSDRSGEGLMTTA